MLAVFNRPSIGLGQEVRAEEVEALPRRRESEKRERERERVCE